MDKIATAVCVALKASTPAPAQPTPAPTPTPQANLIEVLKTVMANPVKVAGSLAAHGASCGAALRVACDNCADTHIVCPADAPS